MKNRIDLYREWKTEKLEEGVRFFFPAQEKAGYRSLGFDIVNDAAMDAMRWYGFRLCMVTKKTDVSVLVTAGFADGNTAQLKFMLAKEGEHKCDLALKDFDIERAKSNVWRELVSLEIRQEKTESDIQNKANYTSLKESIYNIKTIENKKQSEKINGVDNENFCLEVVSAELLKGSRIAVETGILGKPGKIKDTIQYEAVVYNCFHRGQWIDVSQVVEGWESMYAEISPKRFFLEPCGCGLVKIKVQLHENLPQGAHEKTIVRFLPEGDCAAAEEVSFCTIRALKHPYIYHTEEKWKKVAENIKNEKVFALSYARLLKDADHWEVPPLVPYGERDYCCDTNQEHYIMSCAYVYSITKEKKYAEKIAMFFRSFIDIKTGYPARKKGCSQSYVQEGHFFQHLALAYDMICNAGVLSEHEHQGIEQCFRIYMEILDRHICSGHISNWTLSELTGAVYCAMALQDFERIERFVFGPCGTIEQLSHGVMSDGWWYECSVGYNIWVSSMFLHTAHALLPFGINLIYNYFPLFYGKEVDSINRGEVRKIKHGMYNEKWGGVQKNYICIKDLFDAIIPFLDERGVLFGINDSDEKKIEGVHFGSTYDLAYTYYKDPAYIPVIQRFDLPDPIFGHAWMFQDNINPVSGKPYQNAYADNIGIAMLRSQTKKRPQKNQIQAVLRYGCHGFAHGHFDRTELLSIMRYGRSFFNPEHVWWGYGHFMYKFYVQNSNTKNMVVVDGKMQIPADAKRIMFYSGKHLQAAGARTVAKWGYPPFGGMIYQDKESLKDRCKYNACDLPSYDAAPYGEITDITEPITQTRVMAVTDDYIVLFDSVYGQKAHRYESLMQVKGFLDIRQVKESKLSYIKHTGQKSKEPRSDEQFITDCFWYQADGETVASFETKYGKNADLRGTRSSYNEEGSLCLDIYTAWPKKTTQCIGLAAEDLNQKFPYEFRAFSDDDLIGEFSANAWLLGAKEFQMELRPESKILRLEIFAKPLYTEQNYPYDSEQCIFLADAEIELENGEKIPLSKLPVKQNNIDCGMGIGRDYKGGRVLIEGNEYSDAIPFAPQNHTCWGSLEYDLGQIPAMRLTGIVGADNFPGKEQQRRRTYGVSQNAAYGRFITVIEPHEGEKRVVSVKGISEDMVQIYLEDGSFHKVSVKEIDETPNINIQIFSKEEVVEESSL